MYKEDFSEFASILNEMTDYIIKEKGEEVISERHQKDYQKEDATTETVTEEPENDAEAKNEAKIEAKRVVDLWIALWAEDRDAALTASKKSTSTSSRSTLSSVCSRLFAWPAAACARSIGLREPPRRARASRARKQSASARFEGCPSIGGT